MAGREIADGVTMIALAPRASINAYVIGDVLIDAGTRHDAGRLRRALAGRKLSAHALTHVHPDHQGASDEICRELGIELHAPAGEAAEMEAGEVPGMAKGIPARFMRAAAAGPGHPVSRALTEGDEVGGFTAVSSPGHSPDHMAYWRERDRVLIAGDALRNMSYATLRPNLALPFEGFSTDPEQARESAIELIKLRPALVAFGHGRPVKGDDFMRGMVAAGLA